MKYLFGFGGVASGAAGVTFSLSGEPLLALGGMMLAVILMGTAMSLCD
jgi:hypothetical protein